VLYVKGAPDRRVNLQGVDRGGGGLDRRVTKVFLGGEGEGGTRTAGTLTFIRCGSGLVRVRLSEERAAPFSGQRLLQLISVVRSAEALSNADLQGLADVWHLAPPAPLPPSPPPPSPPPPPRGSSLQGHSHVQRPTTQ
jgi:hypothetical protein